LRVGPVLNVRLHVDDFVHVAIGPDLDLRVSDARDQFTVTGILDPDYQSLPVADCTVLHAFELHKIIRSKRHLCDEAGRKGIGQGLLPVAREKDVGSRF